MANNIPYANNSMFKNLVCSICHLRCISSTNYAMHVLGRHKDEGRFFVSCMHPSCKYTTNNWHNFNQHCRRNHRDKSFSLTCESDDGTSTCLLDVLPVEDIQPLHEQIPTIQMNPTIHPPLPATKFMLNMESKHQLSRVGSHDVTKTVSLLVDNILNRVKTQFEIFSSDITLTSTQALSKALDKAKPKEWDKISTEHKRRKIYREKFHYIPPESVYLGKAVTSSRGTSKRIVANKYGCIVPLKKLMEFLLHIPDIWRFVNNDHSTAGVMGDFVDGEYLQKHPLNREGSPFLSLIMSYDDVEIQNPLRSNKLHKLAMFYVTLGNIPPQYRSKLRAIYPFAIARTGDLKKHGLDNLLNDFVSTVVDLQKGLSLKINNLDVVIKGDLIAAICDTPAAALIGGFKESSSFAWKGCRMCNADQESVKKYFDEAKFTLRDMDSYNEQCTTLEDVTMARERVHWSKHFGVNRRSILNKIPMFPVTQNLIQDVMHVLLEGVFPFVGALMLKKYIFEKKYFTLEKLNTSVQNFNFSYLDKKNCPPKIEKQHLTVNAHIKMKAASALVMIYIFPFILEPLMVEGDDEHYNNFLTLIKICILSFSPFCDLTTAGVLSTLINSFCTEFQLLYEEATKPKFHFLVHLPGQIRKFGPLKHQSTLRFEAKHGFFKDHRWRNFNNLPLSLLTKHQLQMSNIAVNENGSFMENFLEIEDILKRTGQRNVGKYFNTLLIGESMYTQVEIVTHKGREFRPGVCLLVRDEENINPEFAKVTDMFYTDDKIVHLIFDHCQVLNFCTKLNAYKIIQTGRMECSVLGKITWPFPLPVYYVNDEAYVTNRFSAYNPFL